jgi:predicted patatin/cPLA2 family phospholipase
MVVPFEDSSVAQRHVKRGLVLIMGDGGIKGGFVAGAADAILKNFPKIGSQISIMMASSAGVGNVLYYLSFEKDHPGYQMWTEVLASKEFMHVEGLGSVYSDRPLYDIDHMVDVIFKQRFPLDEAKLAKSPITFYFPVQRTDVEELMYVSNSGDGSFERGDRVIPIADVSHFGFYDVIRAASAAQFIFDKGVRLGAHEYMDAASIEPFAIDLPGMEGAPKIVILTKRRSNLWRRCRYMLVALAFVLFVWPFRSRRFRLAKYWQYAMKPFVSDSLVNKLQKMEKAGEAILITPARKIGGLLDNNPETLIDTYKHGMEVVESKRLKIEALLESLPSQSGESAS